MAEGFGTLFLIGLLTHLLPGDVTRQAKAPSHQNRLKCQAVFSNSSYTKRHYHHFPNFTVLFQPQKRGNIIKHRKSHFWLHWSFKPDSVPLTIAPITPNPLSVFSHNLFTILKLQRTSTIPLAAPSHCPDTFFFLTHPYSVSTLRKIDKEIERSEHDSQEQALNLQVSLHRIKERERERQRKRGSGSFRGMTQAGLLE